MTSVGPQKPKLLVNHESFRRLSEAPAAESVCWMEYGPAKTGKTLFMASAGARTLFINNGAGMETLKSPLCRAKYPDAANMLFVTIEEQLDDRGNPVKAAAFDMMSDAIDMGLQEYGDQFDTICIDDSTAARRHAMYKGLEINKGTGKSKTLDDVLKYEVVMPAVQDFGIEMNLILQFLVGTIELCKKHKKHLIVGAHERHTLKKAEKIGDQPTIMRIRPGFTGQTLPDDIGGLWDVLTHTEAVGGGSNTIYRHRFNGDEIIQAGVRYGGIFETVESNVDFLKCVERIREGKLNPKVTVR